MLHEFLDANRLELADRCRAKVAARASSPTAATTLEHGVPVLISQLVDLLRNARVAGEIVEPATLSNLIGESAMKHGGEMLRQGFTVDQVVHDYGDLCQAVTELAHEKCEAISVDEFHTFNRCLDSAIAGAVTEFGRQRDTDISTVGAASLNERLGSLAHELRNSLNSATLACAAIRTGHGAMNGATGSVLDRSLASMRDLIDRTLAGVRLASGLHPRIQLASLGDILDEVRVAAQLDASAHEIEFAVSFEPELSVQGDRQMLSSALANLLHNAFKFSRPGGRVSLTARVVDHHVLIDVSDECGGLDPRVAVDLFKPFVQRNSNRSGVGLGLSISRHAVETNGGTLKVRDVPGTGCVFTIELPRR